jgi:hypothetical protein
LISKVSSTIENAEQLKQKAKKYLKIELPKQRKLALK